jgi:hypothetical protein
MIMLSWITKIKLELMAYGAMFATVPCETSVIWSVCRLNHPCLAEPSMPICCSDFASKRGCSLVHCICHLDSYSVSHCVMIIIGCKYKILVLGECICNLNLIIECSMNALWRNFLFHHSVYKQSRHASILYVTRHAQAHAFGSKLATALPVWRSPYSKACSKSNYHTFQFIFTLYIVYSCDWRWREWAISNPAIDAGESGQYLILWLTPARVGNLYGQIGWEERESPWHQW